MQEVQCMPSICPSCGRQDFDVSKTCPCGYYADESYVIDSFIMEHEAAGGGQAGKSLRESARMAVRNKTEDLLIKKIDSWICTFSLADNCIYLSTPALQAFRLRLTIEDLEELIEFVYARTGAKKTVRKSSLSAEEMPDFLNRVVRMIEEKRSRVPLKFAGDELQELLGLINKKLEI